MLAVMAMLAGCATTDRVASPEFTKPSPMTVPRSRLNSTQVAEQYPVHRWTTSLIQYDTAAGVPTSRLELQGDLRFTQPDAVVGLSDAVVTDLVNSSGQVVPTETPQEVPEHFSTILMRQEQSLHGKASVHVRLPGSVTRYRTVGGMFETLVVEEGQTTEFAPQFPADWTPIGGGMSMRLTAWSRGEDGGERIEFGLRLRQPDVPTWNGQLQSLHLPFIVATDLVRTDGRTEILLAFGCGGSGIGGGMMEESGFIAFPPPAPTQGINRPGAEKLRVRVATKVRIDEIPFEIHDVTATTTATPSRQRSEEN